jgi:hypothetical protein
VADEHKTFDVQAGTSQEPVAFCMASGICLRRIETGRTSSA